MKRIFIFSYHGKDTFQTSYYRLLSLASFLSKKFEVYFVHGTLEEPLEPIILNDGFVEIPLNYKQGLIQNFYEFLLKKNLLAVAKTLLIIYYFFFRREIFDLGRRFDQYIRKTNLTLTTDDVVLVSYPSIAIHNLGASLKKRFGCRLILDYRDPGVFGYQAVDENKFVYGLRKMFLKKRELSNLKLADLVIAVSDSIKNQFPVEFQYKTDVIRNGFYNEEADLNKINESKKQFKLGYLGTIYDAQLYSETFFKAIKKFLDKNKIQPATFKLLFVGSARSTKLKDIINKHKLDIYTTITPRTAIAEAYNQLYDANMFLHLKYDKRNEVIPTKKYEYLAFQKPILLPENDFGDLEKSINDYHAGFVCNGEIEIIRCLEYQYAKFLAGDNFKIMRTQEELYHLSRLSQEEKLQALIDGILKKKSRHNPTVLIPFWTSNGLEGRLVLLIQKFLINLFVIFGFGTQFFNFLHFTN